MWILSVHSGVGMSVVPMSGRPYGEPPGRESLDHYIAACVANGWIVEEGSPARVTLFRPGRHVSAAGHIFHLLMSVVTGGLWVIVWLIMIVRQLPDMRVTVWVDDDGLLWRTDRKGGVVPVQ